MLKRKIWVHSPITFALLVLIVGFTVLGYFNLLSRQDLLIIQIVCSVLATGLIVLGTVWFHKYLNYAVSSTVRSMSPQQIRTLERFPMPVVIVGERGDIIWYNKLFISQVAEMEDVAGVDITEFTSGKVLTELAAGGADVACGDKLFTVYLNPIRGERTTVYALYYVDNTYYKNTEEEYKQSRPAVAIAVFDNMEEMAQIAKAGEISQISAEVEMKLDRWAAETSGVLSKIGNDRYLIVLEERHLQKMVEQKFNVLDAVRTVKIGERFTATISIGVGRGGKTMRDCYERARQALDMALGRGGDQVVIKSDESYEFFGGVSKGVEKRSRVRTRIVANAMAGLFRNCETVLIMGHHNSDLDCVGSAVGMWSLITKTFHKKAHLVVDLKTTLALPLLQGFQEAGYTDMVISPDEALKMPTEQTVLVIVDTHSKDFLECRAVYDRIQNVVVIDHHRKMVNYIDRTVVFFHEPFASSASEMVTELIEYLGEGSIGQLEADALLSGIMLDTKNFVLKTGVRTFEAAAFLRKKGADTVEVKSLFSNSFDSYKAKYKIIANSEIYNNMAIAAAEDDDGTDLRIASAQAADELLGIEGVDASFVLYPIPGGISVSARSFGKINVQLVMEKIGGGGHFTMAGAQLKGCSMGEARAKLVAAMDEFVPVKQIEPKNPPSEEQMRLDRQAEDSPQMEKDSDRSDSDHTIQATQGKDEK